MTHANVLTQMKVKSLGKGKYADGQGLWLVKSRQGAGKWILRVVVDGRRREMGLGRWPDVSIAEARQSARDARQVHRSGHDPIAEQRQRRRRANRLTVADAVHGCLKARAAELKDNGAAGRWLTPLRLHVLPKIGTKAIEDIDQHELTQVLGSIWHTKPDTARKAMNRMNLTLKHAAALGLDVDLQAVMKAQALLGKRRHEITHIPSLPYPEAPAFYRWLCTKQTIAALALRFLILTIARSSEVRCATYQEIDGDLWTIPSSRTKTGREHRIPLTDEARTVVARTYQSEPQALLFPSSTGTPLSDGIMSRFLTREGYEARPHGFRATFRTWVEETTNTPFEVKESVLGHQVDGEVVRTYQRSDRLEKRRLLMDMWASFLMKT